MSAAERLQALARTHVGFPPGSNMIVVPRRPARAAAASLALYEAVRPRQLLALTVAERALRWGLASVLPGDARLGAALDLVWWRSWLDEVAPAAVGACGSVAFRIPPNGRSAALLFAVDGVPLAFVKRLTVPVTPLQRVVERLLEAPSGPFRVPRVLQEGSHRGIEYRVLEPIVGAHRPLGGDLERVHAVLEAFQQRTAQTTRDAGAATGSVVCHADFTPRNLRLAADGTVWLFDLDNVRWGPRLADELHYWCAERTWRGSRDAASDARVVVERLSQRGSDDEILAAAEWADAPARTYHAGELLLRREVGRQVREARALPEPRGGRG